MAFQIGKYTIEIDITLYYIEIGDEFLVKPQWIKWISQLATFDFRRVQVELFLKGMRTRGTQILGPPADMFLFKPRILSGMYIQIHNPCRTRSKCVILWLLPVLGPVHSSTGDGIWNTYKCNRKLQIRRLAFHPTDCKSRILIYGIIYKSLSPGFKRYFEPVFFRGSIYSGILLNHSFASQ